jgi:hypothetical protein
MVQGVLAGHSIELAELVARDRQVEAAELGRDANRVAQLPGPLDGRWSNIDAGYLCTASSQHRTKDARSAGKVQHACALQRLKRVKHCLNIG